MNDVTSLNGSWAAALAEVLCGQSFSDIERELKSLRRQAVLSNCPLADLFPRLIRQHIEGQPKAARKDVALRLSEAGLSQRSINELTGISRDTLRKLNQADEIPLEQN